MSPTMRIIMLGTGDFALPTFEHLIETGHDVVALVTQPDRPQGRKQELIPSLIKRSAQSRGIAVEQPDDVECAVGPRPHSRAQARPAGDGGLRPDPFARTAVDPAAGWHQPSRLDPARRIEARPRSPAPSRTAKPRAASR